MQMPGRMILLLPVLLAFFGGCQFLGSFNPSYGINDPQNISVDVEADSVLFAVIGDYGRAGETEEAVADMVKGWRQ